MEFTLDAIKAAARAYKKRSDPLHAEAGEIIEQCLAKLERKSNEASDLLQRHGSVIKERDAALVEVERLKTIITENPLMDHIEAERLIKWRGK